MAWVTDGWWITLELVDAGNNKTTRSYQLQATTDAEAATAAAAFLDIFEAVCAAGTRRYEIHKRFVNDAFALPAAGVQIEGNALIIMTDSVDPSKKHRTWIPAPETDVFLATTGDNANVVDIAHADVVAFVGAFHGGEQVYISDKELVQGLPVSGRRVTKRSRRG